ncbi:MAG: hypothetical protein M9894_03590 [Planctomycetes bacterium]|nr:hypothetical protein [Planctomycetota bacterium]
MLTPRSTTLRCALCHAGLGADDFPPDVVMTEVELLTESQEVLRLPPLTW